MELKGSVTELTIEQEGAHVIVGSHGGALTGAHALGCGVASLICHDAGIGLDDAGIAALAVLERHGVAAAAVAHGTARIGDPEDMARRGLLSHVNAPARRLGLVPGMAVRQAGALLAGGVFEPVVRSLSEGGGFRRFEVTVRSSGGARQVTIVDSASLLREEDDGAIVATGSHGGLPGNRSENALRARPWLVAFNDAGIGVDRAGTRRLPVLAEMGIAAVCVDAKSARIGDGLSTYQTGVLSAVNEAALVLGARSGMTLRDLVSRLSSAKETGRAVK